MKGAQKIFMNTGFLYAKMLITMIVSLYSVRLVLQALGEADYGIFALIGGVIGMLSFLNSAMTTATQRFFSYNLGANNRSKLSSVFNMSVIIHLIIGFLIVIILEVAGIFLFDGVLNIPEARIPSAKIVFHLMVISTFFSINAVPYNAAINAHENFLLDSLVGVFESLMKLGIAIVLLKYQSDRLILYGILIASLTIVVRFIYSYYSIKNYSECRFNLKSKTDWPLLKEMFSYAGWTMFGTLSFIARNQGLAFVLNLNFGVIVNAAYGIANQVNGQLSSFSSNMYKALIPQIIKSEGGGDRNRMLKLTVFGCRVASLLMAFFSIPLIIEMAYILDVWLDEIPAHTIRFCQLILALKLTQLFTSGLIPAFGAVGKIRAVRLTVGLTLILTLPLAILLIKLGLPAYVVLIAGIAIEFVAGGIRIYFAKTILGLSASEFIKTVVIRLTLVYIFTTSLALIPSLLMTDSFLRLILTTALSAVTLIFSSWVLVFNKEENKQILSMIFGIAEKIGIKIKYSNS